MYTNIKFIFSRKKSAFIYENTSGEHSSYMALENIYFYLNYHIN